MATHFIDVGTPAEATEVHEFTGSNTAAVKKAKEINAALTWTARVRVFRVDPVTGDLDAEPLWTSKLVTVAFDTGAYGVQDLLQRHHAEGVYVDGLRSNDVARRLIDTPSPSPRGRAYLTVADARVLKQCLREERRRVGRYGGVPHKLEQARQRLDDILDELTYELKHAE